MGLNKEGGRPSGLIRVIRVISVIRVIDVIGVISVIAHNTDSYNVIGVILGIGDRQMGGLSWEGRPRGRPSSQGGRRGSTGGRRGSTGGRPVDRPGEDDPGGRTKLGRQIECDRHEGFHEWRVSAHLLYDKTGGRLHLPPPVAKQNRVRAMGYL